MKPFALRLRALALLVLASTGGAALAGSGCDEEAKWVAAEGQRHFVVFAGRSDVFYERSGPAFVALMETSAEESASGAIGIYADSAGHPVFGAVPTKTYEELLSEPRKVDVVLKLEISGPQYQRTLEVLQTWDRRARERTLLYPDIALDNILLVNQTVEALNRCKQALVAQPLDWGLEDQISEHNTPLRIPYEYFKELKRLNETKHVSTPFPQGEGLGVRVSYKE